MFTVYFLIAFALFTIIDTIRQFQHFDIVDASLVSYKNMTDTTVSTPSATLTYSIQKRFSQLYEGIHDGLVIESDLHPTYFDEKNVSEFNRRYMMDTINKLSKTYTKKDNFNTKLLSINNEWSFTKPRTLINVFSLKEESLLKSNLKIYQKHSWRNCFIDQVNASLENMAFLEDKNILLGSFYSPKKDERFLRLYNNLECEYKNLIDPKQFFANYCSENGTYFNKKSLCYDLNYSLPTIQEGNITQIYNPHQPSLVSYEDIPLESNSKVQNIATNGNLIVYTTLNDPLEVYYMYKNSSSQWAHHNIQYPKNFKKNRVFQNLGLAFIGDSSKNERQLLVVDLIGDNNELHIIYFIYRFIDGHLLLSSDYKKTIEENTTISWEKLLTQYQVNTTEEVDPNHVYVSGMYDLFKINISSELNSVDAFSAQKFPSSMIKYNAQTKQILIASLQKYLLLVCMKENNEVFSAYQLKEFEDQAYKIKSFDIYQNGLYYAFLVHNKNKYEVFLLNNEYLRDVAVNKLYMVNFDNSHKSHEKTIMDIKLIKNIENEMMLSVTLTSGEMATYSMYLGASRFNRTFIDILDEELDFLSLALLLIAVFAFLTLKFARSIRVNINIRHNR